MFFIQICSSYPKVRSTIDGGVFSIQICSSYPKIMCIPCHTIGCRLHFIVCIPFLARIFSNYSTFKPHFVRCSIFSSFSKSWNNKMYKQARIDPIDGLVMPWASLKLSLFSKNQKKKKSFTKQALVLNYGLESLKYWKCIWSN